MIHLDTSVLVDAFSGARRSAPAVRGAIEQGHRLALSALTLYEWLRGPRQPQEVADQERVLPAATSVAFGPNEAARAAELYRTVSRARRRVADLAIAACALTHDAALWTLSPQDFRDIPGLALFDPDG
jgi:predicted nucleic acid-binding protein